LFNCSLESLKNRQRAL